MTRKYLIGIGAPKAGTTMFASLLSQHPAFCLPSVYNSKATNFFTDRYSNIKQGLKWYYSQFNQCLPEQIATEICPSYFSDPLSPKLIAETLPDAKLVVLLRDPAKRSFSSFLNNKRAGRIPKYASFWEGAKARETILRDSRYDIHIKNYLKYFDRNSLFFILLEEFIKNPNREVARLCEFVGVEISPCILLKEKTVNKARLPRYYKLERFLEKMTSVAHNSDLSYLNKIMKKAGLSSAFKRLNSRRAPKISDELYRQLSAMFEANNRSLAEILGRESMPWGN